MIQMIKMAFRDLARNRLRSILSATALGIGLAILMMMAGVVRGEMKGAMDASILLQTGHLQIRAGSYDESKTSLAFEDLVADPQQMVSQIAALAPVKAITPRLYASGIVSAGDQTKGVRIVGIDPASEANLPYQKGVIAGSYLKADDRDTILVGQPLANKLGLNAGDKVDLLVNTSNGDVDTQSFTIAGLYNTGYSGFDELNVYMPLAKAQAITRTEGRASILFILLKDIDQTTAVANAIQPGSYQVKTYLQLNQLLTEWEQTANSYIGLLYMIILMIAATVIVDTLIMSVLERTREIGILAAIGMKPGRIMVLFFTESVLLSFGGLIIGLLLGALGLSYFVNVGYPIGNIGATGFMIGNVIYAAFNINDTIGLTVATFIVSLLAGLYPAIMAARMEPVQALHSGD
jgi:ABC-type lipoprotein release transport system permease subunit